MEYKYVLRSVDRVRKWGSAFAVAAILVLAIMSLPTAAFAVEESVAVDEVEVIAEERDAQVANPLSESSEGVGSESNADDVLVNLGEREQGVMLQDDSSARLADEQRNATASCIDKLENGQSGSSIVMRPIDSESLSNIQFSNPTGDRLSVQKVWDYDLALDNSWRTSCYIYPGYSELEADLYYFTVYSPGWVFISVRDRSADISWGVFDESTNELVSSAQKQYASSPSTKTAYGYLYPGTYSVLVYCRDGGSSGYYDIRGSYASTIDMSQVSFLLLMNKTYSGKAYKPSVDAMYETTDLTPNVDYTLSYQNNKNVGTAKVIVRGKGRFSGVKTLTFQIRPKGTTVKKVKPSKGGAIVTWKKQRKGITGYQIQYSKKKGFSKAKTVLVKKTKTSKKISKLERNKTYYIRVRTYKKVGGKKYYSTWSEAKKVVVR